MQELSDYESVIPNMDYIDVVCNGKSGSTGATNYSSKLNVKDLNETLDNMNWLIYILFARQDYRQCKIIIEQQLRVTYDHEYLYFIKGQIYRLEGDLNESLRCLQKTIDLNPKNYENFKEIGKTLYQMGRWKQAYEGFLRAESLLQRPDHEVYYFIGELLLKNVGPIKPNLNEVKEYFHKSIQNGKQIESFKKLASIYRLENNFPKAIEMLENSLLIVSSDNADSMTEIGILYLKINDTKKAFDNLFEVTRLNDKNSKALVALGAILQSKNDIDGALNKYKLIDTSKEDTAEIWNNIGLCFFKKRKFIAAMACLKKSVWMSPLNYNCLYNLGLVYLAANQHASAYHTFAAAINLRPNNAECYMLLGVCLINLLDLKNAYVAFERSAMLPEAIKNPLIYLNFAVFCWQTKRYAQSKQNLDNFLKMLEHMSVGSEFHRIAEMLKRNLAKVRIAKELPATTAVEETLPAEDVVESSKEEENDNSKTEQSEEMDRLV